MIVKVPERHDFRFLLMSRKVITKIDLNFYGNSVSMRGCIICFRFL